MGADVSHPVEIPEDPSAWTTTEIRIRGARRAWLLRHADGTEAVLRRLHAGGWNAGLGRPALVPHHDGGSHLRKTFPDDVAFDTPPDLRRGEIPLGLALRLLSAHHGGRARRLVAFLRACVRLHALGHGAEISHVSQERDPRTRQVRLRPHAVAGSVPTIALPDDVARALATALWTAHGIPTPLEAGIHAPVPSSAHGRVARRQALLAEAEALIDPDLAGARALLDRLSEIPT